MDGELATRPSCHRRPVLGSFFLHSYSSDGSLLEYAHTIVRVFSDGVLMVSFIAATLSSEESSPVGLFGPEATQ